MVFFRETKPQAKVFLQGHVVIGALVRKKLVQKWRRRWRRLILYLVSLTFAVYYQKFNSSPLHMITSKARQFAGVIRDLFEECGGYQGVSYCLEMYAGRNGWTRAALSEAPGSGGKRFSQPVFLDVKNRIMADSETKGLRRLHFFGRLDDIDWEGNSARLKVSSWQLRLDPSRLYQPDLSSLLRDHARLKCERQREKSAVCLTSYAALQDFLVYVLIECAQVQTIDRVSSLLQAVSEVCPAGSGWMRGEDRCAALQKLLFLHLWQSQGSRGLSSLYINYVYSLGQYLLSGDPELLSVVIVTQSFRRDRRPIQLASRASLLALLPLYSWTQSQLHDRLSQTCLARRLQVLNAACTEIRKVAGRFTSKKRKSLKKDSESDSETASETSCDHGPAKRARRDTGYVNPSPLPAITDNSRRFPVALMGSFNGARSPFSPVSLLGNIFAKENLRFVPARLRMFVPPWVLQSSFISILRPTAPFRDNPSSLISAAVDVFRPWSRSKQTFSCGVYIALLSRFEVHRLRYTLGLDASNASSSRSWKNRETEADSLARSPIAIDAPTCFDLFPEGSIHGFVCLCQPVSLYSANPKFVAEHGEFSTEQ